MKLIQNVSHFTVFKSFPSISCCSQKLHQIAWKKLAGWTCDVVAGMFTLGGWWVMNWRGKVTFQNCGKALVKAKNQPGRVVLAP